MALASSLHSCRRIASRKKSVFVRGGETRHSREIDFDGRVSPAGTEMSSVAVGMGAAAVAASGTYFIPVLLSAILKYRYDVKNPEGRVIDVVEPDWEYDFIVGESNRIFIFSLRRPKGVVRPQTHSCIAGQGETEERGGGRGFRGPKPH